MSVNKIQCVKLKEELPSLSAPPFPGEVGQEIYEKVSERAWRMWKEDMMIKVINEYRLNLAETSDYDKLIGQMRAFLCLGSDATSLLEIENPERGK